MGGADEPTVSAVVPVPWDELEPTGGLAELLDGRRIEPVASFGPAAAARVLDPETGATVLYLKAAPHDPDGADRVQGEADRLRWLASRAPVPEVRAVDMLPGAGRRWSVLALSVVSGLPASEPAAFRDADTAITVVAEALRTVHGLPVDACPFDASTAGRLAVATQRVHEGRVDAAALSPAYRHLSPERLLAVLKSSLGALPDDEGDVVVIHGHPVLAHLIADQGGLSGLVGWHRAGVGDRYADLAVVAASLARHVSPEALGPFFVAYGLELPSLAKIDAYALLAELS